MEKQKVLILGGGNAGIGKAVAALLKQLDQEMIVIDRPSNIFELTIPKGYNETINLVTTPNHSDGWYRRFEKNSKKRNFKKAI